MLDLFVSRNLAGRELLEMKQNVPDTNSVHSLQLKRDSFVPFLLLDISFFLSGLVVLFTSWAICYLIFGKVSGKSSWQWTGKRCLKGTTTVSFLGRAGKWDELQHCLCWDKIWGLWCALLDPDVQLVRLDQLGFWFIFSWGVLKLIFLPGNLASLLRWMEIPS